MERRNFFGIVVGALASLLLPWDFGVTKLNVEDLSSIGSECGTITAGMLKDWAKPLERPIWPRLSQELVIVQPMTKPSGLMFYMDYKYAG